MDGRHTGDRLGGVAVVNITKAYLDTIAPSVTNRDLRIIHEVSRFKLMTGGQIERLFFHSYADPTTGETIAYSDKSRARGRQAVLQRLVKGRVLARVGERRVGTSERGSASYLYTLDVAGQRLAQLTSTQPRRPYVHYKPHQYHYFAVAELYVSLVEHARSGVLTLLRFDAEPYCWRTYGANTLKPDAFIQVGVERDGQRRKGSFFLEVDRNEEWGAKIANKVPAYVAYYHHERTNQTPGAFPRVLIFAPIPTRISYLKKLIERRPEYRHLFQVALIDDALAVLGGHQS